ncbi:putative metalloprotease with PDZ domain [Mucilaginibacter gracilis]|uniref:Putative metalloprotease with PDZ domain n=1 Tax=Mucilaginibacter gracilis TaxID=423350 RepID=A0A495IXU9_9SPHI|nr:M61 family metallopeptidase [Mucilaginibacter gracilis]RKR81515.1 putative metalloprotease with PDZ domain [Mucilaginibacter gracilis]
MKTLNFVLLLLFVATMGFAQNPIFYSISFPNAAHHEAEVVINLTDAPGTTIKMRMSRSSAGRYATHEFGKNIYNLKAVNPDGSALLIKQAEGDLYEIQSHGSTVKISYTLFANYVDGTYSGIDESHAHLNMPATFLWILGQEKRDLMVQFNDLEKYGWKVATQLKHYQANAYTAPDMQYLMDSPTELSAYKEVSWKVTNTDKKEETIRLATHSVDAQPVIDNFATMLQKVVLEEKAVYGELPSYDYGEYVFLQDVYPTDAGDGMEHRNSTCIVETADKVEGNEVYMLSTFAHEYFHSWNVKRIRPKSLEPFNFEHANISGELWFAEGFTQYYGEMLLVRAGFHTADEYAKTMSGLINSVLNTPGAAKYSPIQSSNYAVFADAGVSIDPTNKANMYTSYYYYGGATALALDLRLRSEFNLTLDDYMRQVWLDYGKPYIPYTIADLEKSLAKVTNNKVFATAFFKNFIYGVEKNNYEVLLAKAGYVLRKANPGKAWMGQITAKLNNGNVLINGNSIIGTPIYNAGLDAGDILKKIAGKPVDGSVPLATYLADKKPGDVITIDYQNRTGAHQAQVTLAESPLFEVVTAESAGQTLTKEQQDFRAKWLSSKVKQ